MSRITDFDRPSDSTRSNLLLQQKLNKRSKEAMKQREITPEILPTKQEVKLLGLDDDNPEAIANKHRKATSIQIQLANMANNSIIDELGWKPSKIKSDITQQMIDEYKAEINQQVKSIDPVSGKELYYFKPSSVDLTPIEASKEQILTEAEKDDLNRKITKRLQELNKIKVIILRTIPDEQRKLDADYNRDNALFDGRPFDIFDLSVDPIIKYEQDKEALKERAELADADRKQLSLEIDSINLQLRNNDKAIHRNIINQAEADKQTRMKINEAEKEIRILKAGSAISGQQAGEDDETYRQRLLNIGREIKDDDEIEREAGVLQTVRAKYNLKDFYQMKEKSRQSLKNYQMMKRLYLILKLHR
jgi:hypothetical protein